MSESTMNIKLIKCPSCGGPIDPPSGESSMQCPYCNSAIVIPESLRKPATPAPQQQSSGLGGMFGMNMDQMLGYGAQWSQVVQLAQQGKKEEAVQKYLSFSSISESDARRTVEGLANTQTYDLGSAYNTNYVAPVVASYAKEATKITALSYGISCLVTGFIIVMITLTVGISLWAAFR